MADERDYDDILKKAAHRAARRATDRELAALANLALIRSGMSGEPSIREERDAAKPTPEELEERLRKIIDGAEKLN